MILNCEKVLNHIAGWIKEYATRNNKSSLVVNLNNNVNSAILILACKKTRLKTFYTLIGRDDSPLASYFNVKFVRFIGAGLEILEEVSPQTLIKTDIKINIEPIVLTKISKHNNGLILSDIDRNDYLIIRNYKKNNVYDLLPLADLFKSELNEIADKYCGDLMFSKYENRYNITSSELEWLNEINSKNNIIVSQTDPVRNKSWGIYTGRQRKIISQTYQIEKLTRHKYNPGLPVCLIRNKRNLVK
jgi:hypothetical protein